MPVLVRPLAFGGEIERLTACHATQARRACQSGDQADAQVGRQVRLLAGDDVEGAGEQAVAGEDRGRFVEGPVDGRLAATQVVVVHGRQVVVDQRVAVYAFEGGGDAQRSGAGRAEQGGALQHQEGPQPLASVEHPVADRLHQLLRARHLAVARAIVEERTKHGFHRVGMRHAGRFEENFEVGLHARSDGRISRGGQAGHAGRCMLWFRALCPKAGEATARPS